MEKFTPRVTATDEMRAVYNAIKRKLKGNDKAIITPGYLRLENALGTANRYDFRVLENQGATSPVEQRLKLSDAFFVTDVLVHVRRDDNTLPVGSGEPHTFANGLVWTTAAERAAIAAIMNTGKLRVEIDGVVYLQALDLFRFRYVDQAQEGAETGAGGTLLGADGWDTGKVFRANTPVFRLNGGSSNDVSVLLGQSVAAGAGAGFTNWLTVHFHGFLAQNAGAFNPNDRP